MKGEEFLGEMHGKDFESLNRISFAARGLLTSICHDVG